MKSFRLLVSAAALLATAAVAHANSRVYVATLYGGNERPALGDLNAYGVATVTFSSATSLCYSILLHNTVANTAAHIHIGPPQAAGAVVLPLPINASVPLRFANCIAAPAALVTAIRANSQNYYVNVHNAAFPGGAARGQLE
jgi:hypothetical protein